MIMEVIRMILNHPANVNQVQHIEKIRNVRGFSLIYG